MPAYNAAETLRQTYEQTAAQEVVDLVVIVDDASDDRTIEVARSLPAARLVVHDSNRGYHGNKGNTPKRH